LRLAQATGGAQPAPAGEARKNAGARTVRVNVLLLSEMPRNPDEYAELNGVRYIYFNSPRLVSPARPLSEPKPRYPKGKLAQQDGAVILQLFVNERGTLDRVEVVCSAPPFEKSALEAVKGIRFVPAQGREGPVKSYLYAEFAYGRGFPCARVPD
jgi:TonB family protein